MKKLLIIFLLMATPAWATSWKIDDPYTVSLTINYMGQATDADSAPTYRVYEDTTDTALLSGTMTKQDDANTTGYYKIQLTLSAANGFEKGKSYNIIKCAAVNSVTGCEKEAFQIEAEVDANVVSGAVGWNASWDLEVESEATDALNAYDPPTRTEATSDKNEILGRVPSATAIVNIDDAYDGTGYAGDGIAIVIDSTNTALALAMVVDAASAGIITVDNQFVGKSLYCGTRKESRKIVASDNNTTDTITIEPGRPFNAAPGNGSDETCYIK